MKGNKKILIIAALLLFVVVTFTTYAIYKSSATGDAEISTAAWVVKVNENDISTTATNTFTLNDITWNTPAIGKEVGGVQKIAPGDSGTVDIVIDADGSEVDVYYEITTEPLSDGTNNITNSKLKAVAHEGSTLTGTIPYSATEDGMKRTITLDVVWEALDDATASGQNEIDMATAGKDLTLPITVTVRQNPTGIQP